MSGLRVLLLIVLIAVPLPMPAHAEDTIRLGEQRNFVNGPATWESTSLLEDGLRLYRPNYLVPFSWAPDPDGEDSRTEIQFQISLLLPILRTGIHFAYTQTSFWEAYDEAESRPFREIVFNPELFYRLPAEDNPLLPVQLDAGWDHTSNGQGGEASRTWDRLFLRAAYAQDRYRVTLSVWEVINRSRQFAEDNPDMIDFKGHHQLEVDWRVRGRDRLSVMNRYNISTGKGATRLRYSMPTGGDSYWFFQVFNGYGESLIDYDRNVTRFGVGVALSR